MPRLSALQKYMVWYGFDNFEKKFSCVISSELPISSRLRSDVLSWAALNIFTPGVCSSTGEYGFHTPNAREFLHYVVNGYLISWDGFIIT